MKATLEDISPVKKKLLIKISAKEVNRELDRAYKDLGKKAKIPGFRPGKVPRQMLERRFGAEVTEDVTRNIISDTFPEALEEVKTFRKTYGYYDIFLEKVYCPQNSNAGSEAPPECKPTRKNF